MPDFDSAKGTNKQQCKGGAGGVCVCVCVSPVQDARDSILTLLPAAHIAVTFWS